MIIKIIWYFLAWMGILIILLISFNKFLQRLYSEVDIDTYSHLLCQRFCRIQYIFNGYYPTFSKYSPNIWCMSIDVSLIFRSVVSYFYWLSIFGDGGLFISKLRPFYCASFFCERYSPSCFVLRKRICIIMKIPKAFGLSCLWEHRHTRR